MEKENLSTQKVSKSKSHPFWKWFWLTFLVVSLAYAWHSYYVPSNDVQWANEITSSQMLANDSNKNTLLFFTAQWCVPCRIMKREVFADKEVSNIINSQVIPVMIDVDNPGSAELIQHFKVRATPTTIVTDAQGKVLDYAVGRVEKKRFLEMLGNFQAK